MNVYQEIEERLSIFVGLYDTFRVVDPIDKIAYKDNAGELIAEKQACFEVFGKCQSCKNCVSVRALMNMETAVKIEATEDHYEFILAAPISIDGEVYVAEFIKMYTKEQFGSEIEGFGNEVLMQQINMLNEKLLHDELTKIYNKRFILERLPVELRFGVKKKADLVLVMCDIDWFKKVNDKYGHLAGDQVLRFFAGELSDAFSSDLDWVARYGGEEFIVLLHYTDIEKAGQRIAGFMETLHRKACVYEGKEIPVTASFGLVQFADETVEELLKKVDEKLYLAKEKGCNRYVL